MPTCAEAIKEFFKNKDQILTAKQIIDAVQKKYPGKWKDVTIRTHTMGCSVNHSSPSGDQDYSLQNFGRKG
jgi:hypothetical protein